MAWSSDKARRPRDWVRSGWQILIPKGIPSWWWQAVVCLFCFFMVLGASQSGAGFSVNVKDFAVGVVREDLTYGQVKAWAQSLPEAVKKVATIDITGFWGQAVSSTPTELVWPVSGPVVSCFGWRPNLDSPGMSLHQGIDIDSPKGTPVVSVLPGVVKDVRESPQYGLVVEVVHSGDLSSVYAHLDTICVVKDQKVTQGELLGQVGDTGNAQVPHLHFELRKNGLEVDPMTILPPLVKGP